MVSVERLMAYGKLPPEASLDTLPNVNQPDKNWPIEGSIKMHELKFRYSAGDQYVLTGITCDIGSSEKVYWYYCSSAWHQCHSVVLVNVFGLCWSV